jgi:hypothetical protein
LTLVRFQSGVKYGHKARIGGGGGGGGASGHDGTWRRRKKKGMYGMGEDEGGVVGALACALDGHRTAHSPEHESTSKMYAGLVAFHFPCVAGVVGFP